MSSTLTPEDLLTAIQCAARLALIVRRHAPLLSEDKVVEFVTEAAVRGETLESLLSRIQRWTNP